MAKIHFFTDVNDLDSQTIAGSAFGVVPNQPLKFNVVDWFTSQSTDIMAYAVCGGEVFIESIVGNSTLINLILKPSQQPPFNFPKVKFFIYRGILKSSLIDNGIIKENAGDLSETLWKAQQALNVALNINEEPSEELLGINNHFFDSDKVEEAFYAQDETIQLPTVKAGWSLARFSNTNFGFQIVLESSNYEVNFKYIRSLEHIIDLSSEPDSTQFEQFSLLHKKEEILNYFDSSAFWGMFYNSDNKLRVMIQSSIQLLNGQQVYDNILSKYLNKNKVYIDIRNEINQSYNFYENYGSDLKLNIDNSGESTIDYYRSGWPFFYLEPGDLPSGEAEITEIVLKLGGGAYSEFMLYLSSGIYSEFYPRQVIGANRLQDIFVQSGFSSEISLKVPGILGTGVRSLVAGYNRLKYAHKIDDSVTLGNKELGYLHLLDGIFNPLKLKVVFKGQEPLKTKIVNTEQLLHNKGDTFMAARIGVCENDNNITFFTIPIATIVNDENQLPLSFSTETSQESNFFDYVALKIHNIRSRKSELILQDNIEYMELTDETENLLRSFTEQSADYLNAITMTKTQLDSISLGNIDTELPMFFFLLNEQELQDNIGHPYTKYELRIRGYVNNSGSIQIDTVNTGIYIYYGNHINQ